MELQPHANLAGLTTTCTQIPASHIVSTLSSHNKLSKMNLFAHPASPAARNVLTSSLMPATSATRHVINAMDGLTTNVSIA